MKYVNNACRCILGTGNQLQASVRSKPDVCLRALPTCTVLLAHERFLSQIPLITYKSLKHYVRHDRRPPGRPTADGVWGRGKVSEVRANYRRPSLPFGMRAVNPRSDELSFCSATLLSATRSNSCSSRMCVDSRLTVRFVECRHR